MSFAQSVTRLNVSALPSKPNPAIIYVLPDGKEYLGSRELGGATSRAVFVPSMPTTEGIIAAAQAARDAGGGYVDLSDMELTLTQTLPFYDNVIYRGNGGSFNMFGSTLISGTILRGDGTFPAFSGNDTDRGASQTYAAFVAEFIKNAGVQGVGLDNFSYGIKVGGKFTAGISEPRISGVHITNCTQWGVWLENLHNGAVSDIRADLNANVAAFVASGGTALNTGNYTVERVKGNPNTHRGKGVMFRVRGTGSTMNDVHSRYCSAAGKQGNLGQRAQTVTITSGTAAISVPDLSHYSVDMGVVFSANVGNNIKGGASESATRWTYFIKSVSAATGAGTVTIADRVQGATITPDGSSAVVQMITAGATLFEVSTEDSGTSHTHCSHKSTDIEQQGTAAVVLQDCINVLYESGIMPGTPESIHQIVGRGLDSRTQVICFQRCSSFDFDGQKHGFLGVSPASRRDSLGIGVHFDWSQNWGALSLYGNPDIWGNSAFVYRHKFAFAGTVTPRVQGQTITVNDGTNVVYEGTAGGTVNMPSINDNNRGVDIMLSNPTAGNAVFAGQAGQNFVGNGTSAATITVPANTNVLVRGLKTGGTFYWAYV
jgi:hypothetical protein